MAIANNDRVLFGQLTQAAYDGLGASIQSNMVYFTTNTNRLYVGGTEYTRPVLSGATKPSDAVPKNSLFVLQNGGRNELHFTANGSDWDLIAVLPATIATAIGTIGDNTVTSPNFGGTIKIPKITVDNYGFVTAGSDVTITLPTPAATDISGEKTSGNADDNVITSINPTGSKVQYTTGKMMPMAGGTFTGTVTLNADGTTGTKEPVTMNQFETETKKLSDAIGALNGFVVDDNGGSGYTTVKALEDAMKSDSAPTDGEYPKAKIGTFYLVQNPDKASTSLYLEYFFVGDPKTGAGRFEAAGAFGGTELTALNTKIDAKLAKSSTINGTTLNDGANTNVPTAQKLVIKPADGSADIEFNGNTAVTVDLKDVVTWKVFA